MYKLPVTIVLKYQYVCQTKPSVPQHNNKPRLRQWNDPT